MLPIGEANIVKKDYGIDIKWPAVTASICALAQPRPLAIIQRPASLDSAAIKAEFAAAIGCKVVIPHHQDFKGIDKPDNIAQFREEFLRRVPDGIFIAPKHGEWVHI